MIFYIIKFKLKKHLDIVFFLIRFLLTSITFYSPYNNFEEGYSLYILIVGYDRWVPELFPNSLIIVEHGSLSIQWHHTIISFEVIHSITSFIQQWDCIIMLFCSSKRYLYTSMQLSIYGLYIKEVFNDYVAYDSTLNMYYIMYVFLVTDQYNLPYFFLINICRALLGLTFILSQVVFCEILGFCPSRGLFLLLMYNLIFF